jgi:hypothetical protein
MMQAKFDEPLFGFENVSGRRSVARLQRYTILEEPGAELRNLLKRPNVLTAGWASSHARGAAPPSGG